MSLRSALKRLVVALTRTEIRTVAIPKLTDVAALLSGRVALITGGSGGIGQAVAAQFVAAGAEVVLAGRNEQKLIEAASNLGPSAQILRLDLEDPQSFAERVETLPNYPDILVNSGGVLSRATFGEITLAEYDSVMGTNVRGMLFLSQVVSNRWRAAGIRGNILNVSSGSQFKPGWTPYQVSKNAVESLTRGMAYFLIDDGIVVNAIAPGPVATSMLGIPADDITFPSNPTGRAVTPEEVAAWCTYLVSDLGRYAVGSTFALTGGNGLFQWERQDKYGTR